MADSDFIFSGEKDPNDQGLFFHNGKPLFVDGKLAFYRACCCDLACQRKVFLVYIGGEGPFVGAKPANPPLRNGYGNSYIMYHAETIDTVSTPPGSAYHNIVWTIEFCWNEYDLDPGDNQSPEVSYQNELDFWACEAQNTWMGSETCFIEVSDVDDPYASSTYTTIQNSTRLNMDGLVGTGNWQRTDYYGPNLKSNCPNCTCALSCEPDGT